MNFFMFLVIVALFYVLTPGILLRLPAKASPKIVALTHGVVFALVWWIIHKPLWLFTSGFTEGNTNMSGANAPANPAANAAANGGTNTNKPKNSTSNP